MAITDRHALGERSLEEWLDAVVQVGVDTVQVREKDLDDRALFDLVVRVRRRVAAGGTAVTVLVNGRLDVALAAGAGGVHLPAAGLPAAALRRWASRRGADPLIGRSTHTPEEVSAARDAGADYVLFGPVFPTPSKARYGPPAGLAALRRAVAVGVPVLALGGVDAETVGAVADAGAAGAAGIRVFLEAASRERFVSAGRSRFGSGDAAPGSPAVVDSRDGPKA